MTARAPLRFGVVAPVTGDVPAWRDQLRGLADSGYSTILMPDVPAWQPAPAPALAVSGGQDEDQDGVEQAGALVWAATDLAQDASALELGVACWTRVAPGSSGRPAPSGARNERDHDGDAHG
jgi:hypothetical protein